MPMTPSKVKIRYYLTALLIVVILVIDLTTPVGFVPWLLYLIPILLTCGTFKRSHIYAITALCTVLMFVALIVGPSGIGFRYGLINCIMGVFAFWLTALFYSKHLKTEQSLKESEQQFRLIAETITEVFWMADPETNQVLYVSPGYEKIWGREKKVLYKNPKSFLDAVHPDDRHRVSEQLRLQKNGHSFDYEYRIVRPDETLRWIWDRGFPTFKEDGSVYLYVGVAQDVTDQKKLESQLHHAQKLEAVGRFAAGVAHDFNNILTIIAGYGDIAKRKLSPDDKMISYLDEILSASAQGKRLISNLLTFGKQQAIDPKLVNINEIATRSLSALALLTPKNIRLTVDLDDKDLFILADTDQLEQVLVNLVTNARDAMEKGGVITIKTETFDMDDEAVKTLGCGSRGKYALLTVTDTGIGMTRETLANIFEPFFTTKDKGKGTGLGLSIVYGIVNQHQGYINVASEPDRGTAFNVYFPLVRSMP